MKTCDKPVIWWGGEYDLNCVLPRDHQPNDVHVDMLGTWFNDDNEPVDDADVPEALRALPEAR